MGGEDDCEGRVESILRNNLWNCLFSWSGKFYIFCQEKVRKVQKPLAVETMSNMFILLSLNTCCWEIQFYFLSFFLSFRWFFSTIYQYFWSYPSIWKMGVKEGCLLKKKKRTRSTALFFQSLNQVSSKIYHRLIVF